ncbi:hypothetical protein [Methylomonas sp. HYX-M1]|uniref:hypothetical protein n=1 Tax=Methylomonas sp. HYX-M1 TaxID=3139307 RepID=UPI00345BD3BF
MSRNYLQFDPDKGYPAREDIYYECGKCGGVIPSKPQGGIGCQCRNIFIDVDAGRVSIKDESKFKIFIT